MSGVAYAPLHGRLALQAAEDGLWGTKQATKCDIKEQTLACRHMSHPSLTAPLPTCRAPYLMCMQETPLQHAQRAWRTSTTEPHGVAWVHLYPPTRTRLNLKHMQDGPKLTTYLKQRVHMQTNSEYVGEQVR
uniref:Uncharacterized protein n=1 Tax=Eutreptiella gymnastica TaxID=73025 RepID=A0A7S4FRV5_9EUGL